ncbi:DUF5819 family protein [Microbacterium halophytorum]|uniref:DUF5819 family protein n=1 Tax=Microbacterium halophytorum TaxID=2067568 RepID=UPI000CFD1D72|nr:DUF5819 family protein [Microbacterium halophytorum]
MTKATPAYEDGAVAADKPRPPRLSRAARVTAAAAVVFLAVHIFFTAVYDTPYEDFRNEALPAEAAEDYIDPYLQQDYRIFAPNPANSDRNLWLRAWVETPDGERVTTKWVDATSIELAEPARRVLRKQLTVQAALRLNSTYFDLSEEQREVVEGNTHEDDDLGPLQDALLAADEGGASEAKAFIRATNFATSYATQAAKALWADDGEILAVQTRAVSSPIIRWDDRFDDGAERPSSSYSKAGWRAPMEWSAQSTEGFAASFLKWAEKAGVDGELTDGEPDDGAAEDAETAQSGDGADDETGGTGGDE